MANWARAIRLGLAAVFGLAVFVLGLRMCLFSHAITNVGRITGGLLSLVGLLIFHSQWRYENKLCLANVGNRVGESGVLRGRKSRDLGSIFLGLGYLFLGLGYLLLSVSVLYYAGGVLHMNSGKDDSWVAGIMVGAFFLLLGRGFKNSG
jgi:hypothetical protein